MLQPFHHTHFATRTAERLMPEVPLKQINILFFSFLIETCNVVFYWPIVWGWSKEQRAFACYSAYRLTGVSPCTGYGCSI